MRATLTHRNTSPVPRPGPRGGQRALCSRKDPALEAWHRQLHAQLIGEKWIVSGRAGHYVYYWAYGRLCWRVYVVPKDPRTAAQRRSRAAFAAASKTWSANQPLTQAQREAWHAHAAQIKSTPRLGQSGPLTAQQDYVACNAQKNRWGLALLSEPPAGERPKAECRMQNERPATQLRRSRGLARSSSGTRRACVGPAPSLPSAAGASPRNALGRFARSQMPFHQHITRPSSDCLHAASKPLPWQYRWHACSPGCAGSIGLARWSFSLPQVRRKARSHELWRGS
jgi:hypothetical protein